MSPDIANYLCVLAGGKEAGQGGCQSHPPLRTTAFEHLPFTTKEGVWNNCYSHFTNQEAEDQSSCDLKERGTSPTCSHSAYRARAELLGPSPGSCVEPQGGGGGTGAGRVRWMLSGKEATASKVAAFQSTVEADRSAQPGALMMRGRPP